MPPQRNSSWAERSKGSGRRAVRLAQWRGLGRIFFSAGPLVGRTVCIMCVLVSEAGAGGLRAHCQCLTYLARDEVEVWCVCGWRACGAHGRGWMSGACTWVDSALSTEATCTHSMAR
jgi:hypothetical protein